MAQDHKVSISIKRVSTICKFSKRKKRFIFVVRKNLDRFCRNWQVEEKNFAVIRLKHYSVVQKFDIAGMGRRSRR